jgi:hypothetical protein
MSSFSKTVEFGQLPSADQTIVAKVIRENNSLKNTISQFKEKILKNYLIVKFYGNKKNHFISIGLKKTSDNLIQHILDSSVDLKNQHNKKLKSFLKNLEAGNCLERGWATNSSHVQGAIHFLDSDFEKLVKKKKKTMNHIFTLVVSTNTRGQANTERAGFHSVGLIQSPYSDNLLSLNIYLG